MNEVSPLWGKSYVEIGMEGHAQHRSQGTPAFFGNAFFRRPIYLVKEDEKGPAGSFDMKLLAEPLDVARRAASRNCKQTLAPALASADQNLAAAAKSALDLDRAAAAKSLAAAGQANRRAPRASWREAIRRRRKIRALGTRPRNEPGSISRSRTTSRFRSKHARRPPRTRRRRKIFSGCGRSGEARRAREVDTRRISFVVPNGWTVTPADCQGIKRHHALQRRHSRRCQTAFAPRRRNAAISAAARAPRAASQRGGL